MGIREKREIERLKKEIAELKKPLGVKVVEKVVKKEGVLSKIFGKK
jgi:hypothetical protein